VTVGGGGCGLVEDMLQSYYPKTGYPGTRSNTRRVPGYKIPESPSTSPNR